MRKLVENQEKLNRLYACVKNELFLEYIEELIKDYKNDSDYNITDMSTDDFTIPGRMELIIDEKKAYLELSSDILLAIYQIILIKTDTIKNKLKGGEEVDLRIYK